MNRRGFLLSVATALPVYRLRLTQGSETLAISSGDRQVLEYRCVPSPYKPYASRLFSPAGVQVLRDAPRDHKHHHALMFAVSAANVNFWEEAEGAGTQRSRSVVLSKETTRAGMRRAGFTQLLDWVDPRQDQVIVQETRSLDVQAARDLGATLLTWRSQLKPAGRNAVPLSGAHYVGLGMRFVETMDRDGFFFNPDGLDGELVRGSERLAAARWCAYTALAGNAPVTVAILDHPTNPRHPARMFTMTTPFAYLAATLNLWKQQLTLAPGVPVNFTYGVAVWDGKVEAATVEALYRRWVK